MLRTIIYIRKSSEDETEKQAGSFDRQSRDLFDFIEKQNSIRLEYEKFSFDPEKDIIYEDKSAKKEGREKFNQMISDIHKRKYDVLLCHDLSRLSRNPIDNGVLIKILDKEYLQYIQIPSNKFSSSPTDKFTFSLFLAVAKYENDQRGKNTSSGMQSKKDKGGTTNLANMGYINTGESKGNRWIEKDGENFTILQDCWKKLLTGEYKVIELYREAVDKGFTRVKSIKNGVQRAVPDSGSFRQVFTNPFYMGFVKVGKDADAKYVKGTHVPMISEDEFEKAQIILKRHGFKCSKDIEIRYENLLENILTCGKGGKFYVDIKTRYYCPTEDCSYRYYSAHGPKECPECHRIYPIDKYKTDLIRYFAVRGEFGHMLPGKNKTTKSIPIDYMEAVIDKALSKITITDKLFTVMKRRLYSLWLEEENKTNKRISSIRKEIEKLEEKNSNMLQNGFGKEDASATLLKSIEESYKDIEQQIRIKNSEIENIREEHSSNFEEAWQSLNSLLEAKSVFGEGDTDSFEPKRHLLLSVFSNLKFMDGEIIPEWKEPFATIANAHHTKQKSQIRSEISEKSSIWLPVLEEVRNNIMNYEGEINIPRL